jgi:hypothetical protein
MTFGVVVIFSPLIRFRVVRGNDLVASAAGVFLAVTDHESSLKGILFKPPAEIIESD